MRGSKGNHRAFTSLLLSALWICGASAASHDDPPAAPVEAGNGVASGSALAADRAALDASLTAIAESLRKEHGVPALGVALVGLDGMEAIGVAGVRSTNDEAAVQAGDRFHLGSCTKAMTATLAALLIHDGALGWDSTIGEVLGASSASMDASWREVTLEELLRHTGGAPASPPPDAWRAAWGCKGTPRECRKAFVDAVMAAPLSQPRGTFTYSNQGYAIAGAMMEQATGRDYESLISERLFAPLGMTSAGFGPPPEASGHAAGGKPNNIDNPPAITPAGRVHMSLEDWSKFIALHLRRDGGEAVPLARPDFERLHALAPPIGEQPAPKDGAALGWMVTERPWGGRVLTHAGSNTVWFCVAWLAPERGFAMVAAINQGSPGAKKASDQAVSAALGARVARMKLSERDRATVPEQNDSKPPAVPSAPPPAR